MYPKMIQKLATRPYWNAHTHRGCEPKRAQLEPLQGRTWSFSAIDAYMVPFIADFFLLEESFSSSHGNSTAKGGRHGEAAFTRRVTENLLWSNVCPPSV